MEDLDGRSTLSARNLPLPPVPGGARKFDTFREFRKKRGDLFPPGDSQIAAPKVPPRPGQNTGHLAGAAGSSLTSPVPCLSSSELECDSDNDGPLDTDDYDDGFSPVTPPTKRHPIPKVTNDPIAHKTLEITSEIKLRFKEKDKCLKKTNAAIFPKAKHQTVEKKAIPIPPPKPKRPSPENQPNQQSASSLWPSEIKGNKDVAKTPIATVQPLVGSKPLKRWNTSVQSSNPSLSTPQIAYVNLKSAVSSVSDLRPPYSRQASEPVAESPKLLTPVERRRQRFQSDPTSPSIFATNKTKTGITSVHNLPDDISNLSVEAVGDCLRVLNIEPACIDKFVKSHVDGKLLNDMDTQDFLYLGFSRFSAKRLSKFKRGWRPNTET